MSGILFPMFVGAAVAAEPSGCSAGWESNA